MDGVTTISWFYNYAANVVADVILHLNEFVNRNGNGSMGW